MASGKTLQSTIEISGVLSPSLQAAINKAADRLAEMSEGTLESADAASRLCAEMDAQESVLKTLQKAYAGYVASGEESSEQAQELAKKIQTVSGELEENRDTLQAAEKAAQGLTDALEETGESAEEAGESAEESSEGYTVLKNVISNLATEAIGKAVEAFKELATEGDTALGKLKAKTGATAAEMEGFEDVMYEVYNANYGESLGDVSEKLSTVIQMTDDLDNASLAQVTKNAIALEDVFDFDVKESMRAVNSLMDQFGITSEQAFNLIVQGAQKGLNQNDDLMDVINEYSAQFTLAGYTAEDMFNMLLNGTEEGTWSVDKLGDAVKEFNIRASDGTITESIKENAKMLGLSAKEAEELGNAVKAGNTSAYDKLIKKLKEMDDYNERYTLGVEMFGTMWEDLGQNAVFALFETQGEIDKTADAMKQMDSAAYDTLESSLSQLGRTVKAEVIKPIADKLTPVIKESVNFVNSKVSPAVDWILDHLPQIGIALGAVGSVIAAMKWSSVVSGVGKAVSAFKGIGTALAAVPAPVLAIIGVLAALAAAFVYLWKNNEDFREKVTAIWEELKGSFSELGGTISDMISQIMPVLSSLASSLMTAFMEIAETLIPVLLDLVSTVLMVVIDLLVQLLPLVMEIIMAVLPVAVELIQELLPIVVQIVQTVLPMLVQFIKQLLPIVTQIVQMVLPVLIQLIDTLLPFVMQIIQTVLPVLIQLINNLIPIVIQIVQMVLPILIQLIETLLPIVMQIIQMVLPVLIQLINTLLPIVIQIIQAVLPILIQLIEMLLPVVMQIIETVLPVLIQLIETLLPIVIKVIQMVLPILIKLIEMLLPIVMQIIEAVLPVLIQVLNALLPLFEMLISVLQPILELFIALIQPILDIVISAIGPLIEICTTLISAILEPLQPILQVLASLFADTLSNSIGNILPVIDSLTQYFSGLIDFITGVFSGDWDKAWSGIVTAFKGIFNMIPSTVEMVINGAIDMINGIIGGINKISEHIGIEIGLIPHVTLPRFAEGGFTDGVSIAGEAGMEAIISFDPAYHAKNVGIWEKAGQLLGVLGNEEQESAGLTSKAGELLTLDDFSLGSLADGTNVVIYYDFSGFTWSPHIQQNGNDDEDDLMARLKAHEAEFFDWLDEFIRVREEAQYA